MLTLSKTSFPFELAWPRFLAKMSRFPIIPSSLPGISAATSEQDGPLYRRTCSFAGLLSAWMTILYRSVGAFSRANSCRLHEALNIRVVLVEHARETRQESAIDICEILRSELRLYIKVGVVNLHRQESRPSARSGLQSTKEVMDATLKSHSWVKA